MTCTDITEIIRKIETIPCIVVGENIQDEFIFCKELQEGNLHYKAVLAENTAIHQGGSLAVANSLSHFCNVKLVTDVADDKCLTFDSSTLKIIPMSYGCPLIKRRFINQLNVTIFYEHVPSTRTSSNANFPEEIRREFDKNNSAVLVYDFGHSDLIDKVLSVTNLDLTRKCLAFTSQLNTLRPNPPIVERIKRSTIWFMNNSEAMVRCRPKAGDESFYPDKFNRFHLTDNVVVTLSIDGISWYSSKNEVFHVPSPSIIGNDMSLGMGDIAMAITSLTYHCTRNPLLSIKLGACAGAAKAGIFGHERSIYPEDIKLLWAEHFCK